MRVAEAHRTPRQQRAETACHLDRRKEDADRRAGEPDPIEINDVQRALHAIGRGAQKHDRHRRRDRRDRQQREAAHIIEGVRDHVAGAEARRPTRAPLIRSGDLRLRRAQQRHRQDAAPGDAQHVGGPSAAPVPRGAGDHRRQSRADAGEKAEPADKLGFAFGQLGNQGLRARPGEG